MKYTKDKKYTGVIILCVLGVFLTVFSGGFSEEKPKEKSEPVFSGESIRKTKEKELEAFIEKIDGISSCRVMISYKDSGSVLYSYNSTTETKEDEERKQNEIVIRRTDGNEYPVTEKTTAPEINGVSVIANGKKGLEIKIAKAVSAGLGADIHNVEVIINERN